jgi:hypothetical protein
MSFLRALQSFTRMFQRLFGMLVSGQMVFLPVAHGGGTVRVRGEFMKFGSSLVGVFWHGFPNLGGLLSLEPSHFPFCPILNTRPEVTQQAPTMLVQKAL